ncbi:acyltransferase [Mesorhizobium sp. WSM3859]|uniref:acyltransferase family protein n=1 Tax=Mesorhizobium sp. WSM3859 TaxID=2029402 RepID=UPI0015964D61|nr:acyltransferase [Mesorhizobium sp. WSM3859]
MKANRIRSLDGLRGLCAIIVMFFHWWLLSPAVWNVVSKGVIPAAGSPLFMISKTPLNVLVAGSSAVFIFFVISGVVLALTFEEVDRHDSVAFIVKRFCRIYLPYAVAILVSLSAMLLVQPAPVPGLSEWFNTYAWSQTITPLRLLNYVLMTNHDTTLDPVIWSLAHELRISLVFPLIFFFMARHGTVALVALVAFSLAAEIILAIAHVHWVIGEFLNTGKYLFLFAFGIWLYRRGAAPGHREGRARTLVLGVSALIAIFLSARIDLLAFTPAAFLLSTVGSILVVALALGQNAIANALASNGAVWFGRISYSLYLMHIPVMLFILHQFHARAPAGLLFVTGIAAAIGVAWLMSMTVERFSQRLGRWLATRLSSASAAKAGAGAVTAAS